MLRSPAQFAAAAGVDVGRVLEHHGIEPASLEAFGARAPARATLRAWAELARRSGDPNFGLRLALNEPVGTYDVLGYIVGSSPDLAHGIAQFVRYQRLLGDARRISLRHDGPVAVLTHELLVTVPDARHLVEHDMALVASRAREFTRAEWQAQSVGFRHPAPEATALHEQLFGGPVRFRQLGNSLRFDREYLGWPLRAPDHRLAIVLERYAQDALRRMPPPDEFAARVRGTVAELLNGGSNVSAAAVARRVRVSPRTLQRRLADEDTTLRGVLDAVRRELAEEYLAQSWLTFEDITLLLGYSDASGFTRAFRRWTGRPPAEYRRGLIRATAKSA